MPNETKLQEIALGLARGESAATIAKEQGVHPRTIQRWASTPKCREQVEAIRKNMLASAVTKLKASASKAVDTLTELMGKETPPGIRLQAARAVLASLVEIENHADLIARIEDLERRADAKRRP